MITPFLLFLSGTSCGSLPGSGRKCGLHRLSRLLGCHRLPASQATQPASSRGRAQEIEPTTHRLSRCGLSTVQVDAQTVVVPVIACRVAHVPHRCPGNSLGDRHVGQDLWAHSHETSAFQVSHHSSIIPQTGRRIKGLEAKTVYTFRWKLNWPRHCACPACPESSRGGTEGSEARRPLCRPHRLGSPASGISVGMPQDRPASRGSSPR
jgi:hypothetical protein